MPTAHRPTQYALFRRNHTRLNIPEELGFDFLMGCTFRVGLVRAGTVEITVTVGNGFYAAGRRRTVPLARFTDQYVSPA